MGSPLIARLRSFISCVVAFSLALSHIPAAADPLSKADYEACQARDETAFRAAIEAISVRALKAGIAKVDYRAVVGDAWRRGGLDDIIDKRVDKAIDEVPQETSWANLLQSLANQQKAQELATAVAERVYRSDADEGRARAAGAVGRQRGRQADRVCQPGCGRADARLPQGVRRRALWRRRSRARSAGDAGKEVALDPGKAAAEISPGAVLRESSGGIAGAAVLLMRRQLANMAERVGARLVGSVLARVVSVVAGGIGLVLIAKDIWDLRHGVLPIIATEMKSKENKEKVQEELANTFSEQIAGHVPGNRRGNRRPRLDIWRDFRSAHAAAARPRRAQPAVQGVPRFSCSPQRCRASTRSSRLCSPAKERPGLLKRLDDGTLSEAVNVLPAPGHGDCARDALDRLWPQVVGARRQPTCRRSSSSASIGARRPTS